MHRRYVVIALGSLLACGLVGSFAARAQDVQPPAESLGTAFPGKPYSPYAVREFPTRPLWGDTHLPTSVVWAGDHQPGPDGKLPLVGNTVDVANATWANTIGAPELITVWRDPACDPALRAFYYVRVIEIPTPRWTAYDAKYFGLQPAKDIPLTLQERACTSPIWYTP